MSTVAIVILEADRLPSALNHGDSVGG